MTTATASREERVGEALCAVLPRLLRASGASDNHCILATRLTVLACQQVGIKAEPLACGVIGLSPDLAKFLDNGGPWGPDAPGWSVAIGMRKASFMDSGIDGWNGHLVALLGGSLFVDTSIGQIQRPKHDLLVEPFYAPVSEEFLSGAVSYRWQRPNGTAVLYEARRDDKSFLTAKDWTEPPKRDRELLAKTKRIVEEAIK